ncbi:MAG TPA: DNA polymerase ligase N-terminal domain-containing protein [Gemmatimonadales bacterium]|jgi:bifunctional non-homologous end joining protein LigD
MARKAPARPPRLAEYRRKRNFSATPEPRGSVGSPAAVRRFVIHKHDASQLHYDLRLEIGGVYASWAIPKGPSMNPADKRLAAAVEDHPIDYGEFEGVIPSGYGAGTVMQWDTGVFTVGGDASPEEQLAGGEIRLVMLGKKLKGAFTLVRMHGKAGGKNDRNWLMIKRRDEYADDGWEQEAPGISRSVQSNRTMDEITGAQTIRRSRRKA